MLESGIGQDFSEIGGPSGFGAVQHTGMFRGAEHGEAPCLALSDAAPGLRLSLGPARTAVRQHKCCPEHRIRFSGLDQAIDRRSGSVRVVSSHPEVRSAFEPR